MSKQLINFNIMRSFLIFSAFLALSLMASNVNHIDDTDETYGYYEPLHYLLFQRGLQTWEYAPDFAIRSYSFIFPIYLYCLGILRLFPTFSKVTIFQLIRVLLGIFTAYSQTKFVKSISESFDENLGLMTALFIALSPGIFYTSTSLLPSAVAMNLVMLSTAACLSSHFSTSIFWGCLAVLWTGWPFVALLFVPLGVYMVVSAASTSVQKTLWLLAAGVVILGVTFVPTLLLDHHYYQKWTCPSLNILLYNAIGGSGDELYGVEPVTYYILNLILNAGLAWPLAILSPLAVLVRCIQTGGCPIPLGQGGVVDPEGLKRLFDGLVVLSQAGIWLGILFSRPHKEERFMYPIYPALSFLAAVTLQKGAQVVDGILMGGADRVVGEISNKSSDTEKTTTKSVADEASNDKKNAVNKKNKQTSPGVNSSVNVGFGGAVTFPAQLLLTLCFCVSGVLFVSRVTSNYVNYKGYLTLWTRTGDLIRSEYPYHIPTSPYPAEIHSDTHNTNTNNHKNTKKSRIINVCTGSEWYQFPSHFTLPQNAKLMYLQDGFGGILPQHFATINGTSRALLPLNDKNQEEMSRYVTLQKCDYIVLLVDKNKPQSEWGWLRRGLINDMQFVAGDEDKRADREKIRTESGGRRFSVALTERVISSEFSTHKLSRAYFVPNLSPKTVNFQDYVLFRRERK